MLKQTSDKFSPTTIILTDSELDDYPYIDIHTGELIDSFSKIPFSFAYVPNYDYEEIVPNQEIDGEYFQYNDNSYNHKIINKITPIIVNFDCWCNWNK